MHKQPKKCCEQGGASSSQHLLSRYKQLVHGQKRVLRCGWPKTVLKMGQEWLEVLRRETQDYWVHRQATRCSDLHTPRNQFIKIMSTSHVDRGDISRVTSSHGGPGLTAHSQGETSQQGCEKVTIETPTWEKQDLLLGKSLTLTNVL